MNLKQLTLILVILGLFSCRDENLENASRIRLDATNDFLISSITPGSNGSIWCLGQNANDELMANQYDASFNLLKTINLTETKGIDAKALMQPDTKGGWLHARLIEESNIVRIELTVLNEEFEEIKSTRPITTLSTLTPTLVSFVALEGGDYVLNYNRFIARRNEDVVIRLDPNLVPIWEAKYNDSDQLFSDFIENTDGEIQVASLISLSRSTSPSGSTIFYLSPKTSLRVSLIGSEGQILLDSQLAIQSHHTSPIGISHTADEFIFNFISNDEHIQQYASMSFDGTQSNHVQLGFNYINHQIVEGYDFGHFPHGQANPLPRTLKSGQGHLIYSEVDKKLQFLEVGPKAELTWKFPIHLPEFDELLSYRQLFTDHETIIVGVSYRYLGKEYFTLQELGVDGKVL
jgi:hypothetical protein